MNTPSTSATSRPRLSALDKGILALHVLVAAALGIIGFAGVDDPSFGDLQRFVIVMLVGAWVAGVIGAGLAARRVAHRRLRAGLLLAGPPAAMLLLIAALRLG
jgi:hypothetical protein